MTALTLLERVDPQLLVFAVLVVLVPFAVLALVIAGRNRSDRRAAARTQARHLARRLPRNFDGGWDRLDEHGRPW